MQTYTVNSLAEQLERDRGTVVKALRNVPPDATVKGRPQWKIATASRAVEAHLRNGGNTRYGHSGIGSDSRALAALNARFDQAEAAMQVLPTIEKRRDAARALLPLIVEVDKATRQVGLAHGQNSDFVHLRADEMLRLIARGLEGPTGWTHDQLWEMIAEASE